MIKGFLRCLTTRLSSFPTPPSPPSASPQTNADPTPPLRSHLSPWKNSFLYPLKVKTGIFIGPIDPATLFVPDTNRRRPPPLRDPTAGSDLLQQIVSTSGSFSRTYVGKGVCLCLHRFEPPGPRRDPSCPLPRDPVQDDVGPGRHRRSFGTGVAGRGGRHLSPDGRGHHGKCRFTLES